MPAGRPTSYKPEYCERVVELGKQGMSQVQIACELDVIRQTMQSWAQAHPEFSAALARAKAEEQAWWERAAVDGTAQNVIGPVVWRTSMAARFRSDYTERKELTGQDGAPLVPEVSDARRLAAVALLISRSGASGEGAVVVDSKTAIEDDAS